MIALQKNRSKSRLETSLGFICYLCNKLTRRLSLYRLYCVIQEEEVKESLAYKVISEEQTNALKELTPHELEA
jgi:hypothetical protein